MQLPGKIDHVQNVRDVVFYDSKTLTANFILTNFRIHYYNLNAFDAERLLYKIIGYIAILVTLVFNDRVVSRNCFCNTTCS